MNKYFERLLRMDRADLSFYLKAGGAVLIATGFIFGYLGSNQEQEFSEKPPEAIDYGGRIPQTNAEIAATGEAAGKVSKGIVLIGVGSLVTGILITPRRPEEDTQELPPHPG